MHRVRGFDLQCREAIALRVSEKVRDLAREIRSRRRVSAIILYGSFARGDFHEASDVDLIVLGTHGRRGFRRFALGSVAEETARNAGRPVLLLPAHASHV